jgi:replicative DNA helicase
VTAPAAAVEAEESVLGAILSAASYDADAGHRLLDQVVAVGLVPADFWRPSCGVLFGRLLAMREARLPLDAVSVGYELERRGAEPHVVSALHRLAHEVVAFTPAPRWAAIVHAEGQKRGGAS